MSSKTVLSLAPLFSIYVFEIHTCFLLFFSTLKLTEFTASQLESKRTIFFFPQTHRRSKGMY